MKSYGQLVMESVTNSYTTRKLIIEAWGRHVEAMMDAGWQGYLITLTFRHIPGSERSRAVVMERELERVYSVVLNHSFNRPRRKCNQPYLPQWIGAEDRPVAKHEKKLLRDVTVNDGQHLHVAALFYPTTRLEPDVKEHFENNMHLYIHGDHPLHWIDVTPIEYDARYVVGYAFKTVRRRASVGVDGFIVLPRHLSELPTRTPTPNFRR